MYILFADKHIVCYLYMLDYNLELLLYLYKLLYRDHRNMYNLILVFMSLNLLLDMNSLFNLYMYMLDFLEQKRDYYSKIS